MPEVLMVAPGNEKGGAATHLMTLAKRIQVTNEAHGIELALLGEGDLASRMKESGYPFLQLPSSPMEAMQAIRDEMASRPAHVILHAHGPRLNVLTARVAKKLQRRWTTTLHSHPDYDFLASRWKSLILTRLHRRALGKATGIFVINQALGALFPKQPTFVVPNAVTLKPLPQEKLYYESALCRQYGLPEDAFVVGTAARLDKVKDLSTIVRALVHLRDLPIHFVLAGEGPERENLLQLARALNVADRFHLVGFIQDVAPFYAGLCAHVLSSRSEGTPSSLLEAALMGVVNVGTDIPGIAQMVTNRETGLLFPVGDDAALADALRSLWSSPESRQLLVERFRLEVLPRFSPERMLQCYLDGYAQLGGFQTAENATP